MVKSLPYSRLITLFRVEVHLTLLLFIIHAHIEIIKNSKYMNAAITTYVSGSSALVDRSLIIQAGAA
jgi:hypothetical protein